MVLLEQNDTNFGYNAQNGTFGDMTAFGIIDPVKVTRVALQGAASVASLMITTEAMVGDIPEPKADIPAGGMGGMSGMGGMGGMGF